MVWLSTLEHRCRPQWTVAGPTPSPSLGGTLADALAWHDVPMRRPYTDPQRPTGIVIALVVGLASSVSSYLQDRTTGLPLLLAWVAAAPLWWRMLVTGLYVGPDGLRVSRFWSSRRIEWGWVSRVDTVPVKRGHRLVLVLNDGSRVPTPVVRTTSEGKAVWYRLGDWSLSMAYVAPGDYETMREEMDRRLAEARMAGPVRPTSS